MSEEIKTTQTQEEIEAVKEPDAAAPVKSTAVKPTDNTPADAKPAKKKSKAGKVVGAIVGVLALIVILAVIAAAVLFGMATKDNMPAAPTASPSDMNTFIAGAVQEVLEDNTITIESRDIDMVLDEVKASVNGSTDMIEVKELFCVLADGKGTIYSRVYIGTLNVKGHSIKLNKTLPVQAEFELGFNGETKEITVILGDVRCGSIKIPQSIIDTALTSVQLPEEMRVQNGNIYYDTTNLDTKIDDMLAQMIASYIKESSVSGFLGNLLGEETAGNLISSVTQGISSVAANATDIEITGAHIADNQLIIEGHVI